MKRGFARFWYRFKNRFRIKPGMGEPLAFLCGSEAELRRVTTWACHLNPDVFAGQNEVVFWYLSPCENWEPEQARCVCVVRAASEVSQTYLDNWGAFILRHNLFTGTQWTRLPISEDDILAENDGKPSKCFPRFFEEPVLFIVRVHPPSAHEQAEALLSLSEWLDGKVSEAEKWEMLQLPADVVVPPPPCL